MTTTRKRRRRIQIHNETLWSTTDLRRILTRAASEELPETKTRIYVRVEYSWGYLYTTWGWADIGGEVMHLFLPRTEQEVNLLVLLFVLVHEMGHLKGLRHRDMKGLSRYRWEDDIGAGIEYYRENFPWIEDCELRLLGPRRRRQ